MITLITGTPGSGKTAYSLDMMVKLNRLDNARRLYVHGIPELKIAHEIVVCDSPSCDYCSTLSPVPIPENCENPHWYNQDGYLKADQWHEYAEKGAILFFDEVQNIHRPRNSAAAVPPAVAAYEVHRHRGLDFFMITQNPSLIDGNVRALVSRHIHLSSTWARRLQYEFPQCKTDLTATIGEGVKSNYVLPKDVFSLYKSASLHTKLNRKKPLVLYGIPILIVLIFALIYFEYTHMKNKISPDAEAKLKNSPVVSPVNLDKEGGVTVRDATAARAGASPFMPVSKTESQKQVLNMPKLFRDWSSMGVKDDDLKLLPPMCYVASEKFVKCAFSKKLSFRYFFKNIACTSENCFAFLFRVPPQPEQIRREPIKPPELPFSADNVTAAVDDKNL